jgi:hypothetical protein
MAPIAREFRFGIGLPAITAVPTDTSGVPDLTLAYPPSLTDEELLHMPPVCSAEHHAHICRGVVC